MSGRFYGGSFLQQILTPADPDDKRLPQAMHDHSPFVYHFSHLTFILLGKLYLGLEIHGRENLPKEGPYILAANHASHLDPPLLSTVTYQYMHFWGKQELYEIPYVGTYFRKLGTIPINREIADLKAVKQALGVIRQKRIMALFPEGTRSETGELQEGQEGGPMLWLRTGVPLVPVYIHGSYDSFPPHARFPRPRKVEIYVGKPISLPKNFTLAKDSGDSYQPLARFMMRRIRALKMLALSKDKQR